MQLVDCFLRHLAIQQALASILGKFHYSAGCVGHFGQPAVLAIAMVEKKRCVQAKQSLGSGIYSIFNCGSIFSYSLLFIMIQHIIRDKGTRLFIILAGVFIATTLIAEIIGVKIFSVEKTLGFQPLEVQVLGEQLSLNLSAGVVIWPVVFIMTDILNEYYGQKGVRFLSIFTAILISFTFVIFMGAISLSPADFFVTSKTGSGVPDMEAAYGSVLGQGGKIIIGSISAFLLSQLIDVFTFHRIKKITGEKKIWLRATGSTLVSQFVDSFVVLFIAFYIGSRINATEGDFVWSFKLILAVGCVNYAYKFIVAVIMTPVIYLVHGIIERYLGQQLASEMKAAAMQR